ncbi:histone-lysine N-methyltransferase, H3 lysine-79 specific [Gorgonomyces haynaldii]|nr:histone-lysine N-methyltransferase, H3 lysine-79 specific [Gorgonomyces haynaldii]
MTSERYTIAEAKHADDFEPVHDIYNTTQLIVKNCIHEKHGFGDEKQGVIRRIMKACHKRLPLDLKRAVIEFNEAMRAARRENLIKRTVGSFELISNILEQSYARAVSPQVHILNDYEGFSNNVYGEIKASFVHDLIKQTKLKPHQVFLDMGSGIGNVVLQVAAETLCESYGIEIMDNPAHLAKLNKTEFLARTKAYGIPCGKIVLRHGDFLEDELIHQVISKADVIFVNNYAFDPALNQSILAKFLDLKEKTQVVSLRSFVSNAGRQTSRRSNSIESIFTVKEHTFGRDKVSWMVEGGKYYVHTVDRSQMQ